MTTKWFLKCKVCKKPWAIDYDSVAAVLQPVEARSMTCPHCGNTPPIERSKSGVARLSGYPAIYRKYHIVMGKVGPSKTTRLFQPEELCVCDGRCTNARGPNCECSCGGVNHGSQRTVKVWRDAGAVPSAKVA